VGTRSEVTSHAADRPGNGSSRTWSREIAGTLYAFTLVTMPDGEVRVVRAAVQWLRGRDQVRLRMGDRARVAPGGIRVTRPAHCEQCERVTTHELADGDVILVYGMRLRLSGRRETTHAVNVNSPTLAFDGEVLNRDEVTGEDGRAVWPLTGLLHTRGEDAYRWTVQGNGLATWVRVTA
jgi:hypothetical protein